MLFSLSLHPTLGPVLWITGGIFAVVGLIALASPRTFAKLAHVGNHWVDSSRWLNKLDTRVDVDSRLLPYSRWLGAAVLAALGAAWFALHR